MIKNYKSELNILLSKKKKEIPTVFSVTAYKNIIETLRETPQKISLLSKKFDNKTSLTPVIKGKWSFRETLIHILNIEILNYTTIYPAYLLDKPVVYPLHAERDIKKLNLFKDFSLSELVNEFKSERRKLLNFLEGLDYKDLVRKIIEKNKAREETIYWRLRGLALHDFTHIHILNFQLGV